MLPTDLAAAYRRTSFFVDLEGERLCLRIGQPAPRLDAWLVRWEVQSWAFVTAYNPGSVLLDEAANRARQADLATAVERRSLRAHPGEGVGDDGRWPPEPSLLVLGMTREEAYALGRAFGQAAVVFGELGQPPVLLDCTE